MRSIGNANNATDSAFLKRRHAGDSSDATSTSTDGPVSDSFGDNAGNGNVSFDPAPIFGYNPTPTSTNNSVNPENNPIGSSGPGTLLLGGDAAPGTMGTPQIMASDGGSSSAGGGSTSSSGSSGSLTTASSQSAGLIINVNYDASVANAPAAFKTDVADAVQYFESQFTNPITININVGYGEVDGLSLGSGALGESMFYIDPFNYSQVKNALVADATSANDMSSIATLPSSDPTNGGTFYLSSANAKALGLISGSYTDGYVGFSSTLPFDYNNSDGVTAGQYDFMGTVMHEISEVLGRTTDDGQSGQYTALDLFRYSAPGVRNLGSGTTAGYFSVNGGQTNLGAFNTNSGGDYGDWANSVGNDSARAFASSGAVDPFSATDLTAMDAIGYNLAATGPTAPTISSFSPDSGVVGDGITNATTLTLAGTATASSTVNVYDGATLLGTATVNGSGAWSFTTATLASGSHTFTATDTVSGSTSAASSPLNVTIDTTAPAAPTIGSITPNGTALTMSGTAEANSTVKVYDNGALLGSATANGSGAWTYTTAALGSSTNAFLATATDAAGNTSLPSSDPIVTVGMVVSSGQVEIVHSGDTDFGTAINGGGTQQVLAGGVANGTTISSGGQQLVYGSVNSTTVGSGGQEFVLSGGTASGTVVSAGGVAVVESGGTGSSAIVSTGGTLNVLAGGTVWGDTVNGQQTVYGTASNTTVNNGGEELVASGATANGTTVNSGGLQLVSGTANGTTVSRGGSEYILSGGSGSGTKVSGGIEVVFGTDSATTITGGGTQYVYAGGTDSGTTINSGLQVLFGKASGTTVNSGGEQYVVAGGSASGTTINSGGLDVVFGTVSGTTISSGGFEYVMAGATASGTKIKGGYDVVFGTAASATISGGMQYVYGLATATTVSSGGWQLVEAGATVSGTTVNSGGELYIVAGGTASSGLMGSGAIEVAFGTDSGTTISGGTQYDYGTARGDTVLGGGMQIVEAGATASGTTVNSGGEQYIVVGGSVSATRVASGGIEVVLGTDSGATISGGTQCDYGIANGDTLLSGGIQVVEAGATASGTHVNSGGYEYVASGGVASATTISGGLVEIASGGSIGSAPLTFATSGGGTLQLDASISFNGLVAGFGLPDNLDLRDIAYVSGTTTLSFTEASNNTSGTLTVSDGTHTANIALLGQYVAAQFSIASDGHGGTMVTDPPLTGTTQAQSFLTQPQHA